MTLTLKEIADFLGAALEGDPATRIEAVSSLETAQPGSLSFLATPKYAPLLKSCQASALILSAKDAALRGSLAVIISPNPQRDFARVTARWFSRFHLPPEGVHPTALVDKDARMGKGCRVGPYVVVEAGAEIGDDTTLFPFCYIGPGAKVGAACLLYPRVTVMEDCRIGDRVIIHSGVVIGADGFGFAQDFPNGYVKVPQIGWVEIADDVEIQANSCVDRGALGPTRVGRGTKVDNLVQIAHNVQVGEHSVLCAQSGVSGSTKLGNWVTLAGQVGVTGHIEIGDGAIATAQAGVGKDVKPKAIVTGTPSRPMQENLRGQAELARLPQLRQRVGQLEKKLASLEKED